LFAAFLDHPRSIFGGFTGMQNLVGIHATGVGEGGKGALPPNLGEKLFFGQTSCNIRAVDIFWKKEEQAPFIF